MRCVLFASASVSVSQISWTHTDPTVFLFHRSSNTPSANIKSGLDSTEAERGGQRDSDSQGETLEEIKR